MALWFASALTGEGTGLGWQHAVRITIAGGTIAAIEAGVPPGPGDERHRVALPGLGNLHSHAFQRALAGCTEARVADDDGFWTWRRLMYRFLDRLTPDDIESIAAFAYAEMLERGFTRVGEFHYVHHGPGGIAYAQPGELGERIVAAADAAGIGLTLLVAFYAHGGLGGIAPLPGQRRFVASLGQFATLVDAARRSVARLPDGVVGVAPHSLRAVTPGELRDVVALGAGGPVHMHIAEQAREVEECLAFCGARPVAWLLGAAPVDASWCLVHATHVTEAETAALAASGATVGLCPITEANLGDGIFPAERFAGLGGEYGIGSDANGAIDAAAELALLEYGQRLSLGRRTVMAGRPGQSTGRALFDAARQGGARALAGGGAGLEVGGPADIVSLRAEVADEGTDDAALDAWIFAPRQVSVDCVWRRGRRLVDGGRHLRRDALAARYAATLARLRSG
jgi:formiminoglutamate deiminase